LQFGEVIACPPAVEFDLAMIVNTRRLFARLLRVMRIDAVCDVGSMNGADALMFRSTLRRASVYAFEPNPENFRLMQADPVLREQEIQLVPLAATNYDGAAEFFQVKADYSRPLPHRQADYSLPHYRRGMSSLYRRPDGPELSAVIPVRTTRLDTFLADKTRPGVRWALWIDTEGKAYEVIEGAAGIAGQVHLLHVEVETSPCIGSNQKLYPEVKALLRALGFVELATDQAHIQTQFNALFVRRDLPAGMWFRMGTWLALARVRRWAVKTIVAICPACIRRLHARRT
jgi:FkbM family methyltransferase